MRKGPHKDTLILLIMDHTVSRSEIWFLHHKGEVFVAWKEGSMVQPLWQTVHHRILHAFERVNEQKGASLERQPFKRIKLIFPSHCLIQRPLLAAFSWIHKRIGRVRCYDQINHIRLCV